jgi:hypothetical protein
MQNSFACNTKYSRSPLQQALIQLNSYTPGYYLQLDLVFLLAASDDVQLETRLELVGTE